MAGSQQTCPVDLAGSSALFLLAGSILGTHFPKPIYCPPHKCEYKKFLIQIQTSLSAWQGIKVGARRIPLRWENRHNLSQQTSLSLLLGLLRLARGEHPGCNGEVRSLGRRLPKSAFTSLQFCPCHLFSTVVFQHPNTRTLIQDHVSMFKP